MSMEHAIDGAALRALLVEAAAGRTPEALPPRGTIVRSAGRVVARRTVDGALHLRCFRAAHGCDPVYADLAAALRALVGPPAPCTTCGGGGWLEVGGRAAREAAAAALALGAYRGVPLPPGPADQDLHARGIGLAAILVTGGNCAARH